MSLFLGSLFRHYNNTLEKIVALYNDLRLNCIPVEFKLIEEEMDSLDNNLQPAENTLTWHSTEIKVSSSRVLTINTNLTRSCTHAQTCYYNHKAYPPSTNFHSQLRI